MREGTEPPQFALTSTPLGPDLRFGVDHSTSPIANFHVDVVLHTPGSVLPGAILDRSNAGSLVDPLTGLDRLAVLALRFHITHGVKAPVIIADMNGPVLPAIGVRTRYAGPMARSCHSPD